MGEKLGCRETNERKSMTVEWIPPVATREEQERLAAIEAGFPDYARGQVVQWVMRRSQRGGQFSAEFPDFLSRKMKRIFSNHPTYFEHDLDGLPDGDLANVVDCVLVFVASSHESKYLKDVLEQSRAGWSLVKDADGKYRVTETIPSGVSQSFEDVMNKTSKAGKLLAEAFEAAYGVSPNPNHAYDVSIKAVETLACPTFLPNSTKRATLGAVITHLERKDISLPLIEKNAKHGETITKMMRLLWEGGKRHGEEEYEHISLKGARTAHALATCLVSMIHEDVLTVS